MCQPRPVACRTYHPLVFPDRGLVLVLGPGPHPGADPGAGPAAGPDPGSGRGLRGPWWVLLKALLPRNTGLHILAFWG